MALSFSPVAQELTFKQGLEKIKKEKAAAKAKYEAKKASRPETASPRIAEAKPNAPVKKESFTEKIARIKADGNKVGVLFTNADVYIKPPKEYSSFPAIAKGDTWDQAAYYEKVTAKHPKDTVDAYAELNELAGSFVQEMNTAFDTDVFELIAEVDQVPYRQVFGNQLIDNWWATKYKIVVTYSVDSWYDVSKLGPALERIEVMETYKGSFTINTSLMAMEYFLKKGKPNQKVVVAQAAMGNYYKDLNESPDLEIGSITDIQNKMDGAVTGDEVYNTLVTERVSKLEKIIAKKKK